MTLAEWFAKRDENNPKPKYNYGDRVMAKFSGVPLVGMVIREDVAEKRVLVHGDLPLVIEGQIHNVVWVGIKTVSRR